MSKRRKPRKGIQAKPRVAKVTKHKYDPSKLKQLPVNYQDVSGFFEKFQKTNPFALRKETFLRIEKITGRPLICYVSKIFDSSPNTPSYIDHSDLTGFGDLTQSINEDVVDIFIMSNGGSAEASERIVDLLRERFRHVRFIVPSNAYSAATLLCFSGDEVIMDELGTLGPIDPQINGIPVHAIKGAFERIEERLKKEGPKALTAYMPLIMKYDLHIFELCQSAEDLSRELAQTWLSTIMLKGLDDKSIVKNIVEHFSNYDIHKSHSRGINRSKARDLGLNIIFPEDTEGLADLVRSLYNQYDFWFNQIKFYKMFENSRGINWGRLEIPILVRSEMPKPPQSDTPEASD
ncbi:MAG: hypothetical protein RX316_10010 [bacterium]|nr:hypothetical protein [bacterium]